jgi:energy-coupling factor transporter ATP-binding protein EcfA2
MKSITNIQFVNYKAFYQDVPDNNIDIPFGKNVLIYGENGSGKSSIYEGLKQFFNSANNTVEEIPSRHIRVPKLYEVVVNEGAEDEFKDEKQSEVAVKLTFTDSDSTTEQKIFGVPTDNVKGTKYISNANLLNSFLSYRELLKTYLMDNLKDREEFRKKFALLMFDVILAKTINSSTQKTYFQSWEELHYPRTWYKEENLEKFLNGAQFDILKINLILKVILHYFDPTLNVQLKITKSIIEKHHSLRMDRWGKYPNVEFDLLVKLNGEDVENEEENHLTVLNEARLSSLAISIYLATLVNTPQQNFDYKILFLDDIFIGLDMSNRKPLLQILSEFKKPLTTPIQDEETGKIVEVLSVNDGILQTEDEAFFKDYQIFITTYDRHWFEISRQYFEANQRSKWHFVEMFIDNTTHNFSTPFIIPYQTKLVKAESYLHKHDYRACASYLRALCEEELQRILPNNLKHFTDKNQQGNIETKGAILNDLLINFEKFCELENIPFDEYKFLKTHKNHLLNTLSHNDISSPIYKAELLDTLNAIKNLSNIQVIEIPNKYQDFNLFVNDKDNNKITVRFRKRDTILIYNFKGNLQISNNCSCDLESSECKGKVLSHNTNCNSIQILYLEVCKIYEIEATHNLFENIYKRIRKAEEVPISLNQIITSNNP